MFAEEEGIPLDYQVVDLMTGKHLGPEYRAINPNCLAATRTIPTCAAGSAT